MEDFSPIARLERIVLEARTMDVNAASKAVWGKIFGYKPSDRLEAVEHGLEYLRLVEHVDLYLGVVIPNYSEGETNKKSMLSLKEIGFTFTSTTPWGSVLPLFDNSVLVLLEVGKALYNANYNEVELKVSDECINDLKDSLDKLFQEVFYSNLSRTLKLKLCSDISQMIKSVRFYELRGADGLQESMATLTGRYAFNSKELSKNEAADVRIKFGEVFNKFITVINHANTLCKFVENVPDFVKQLVVKS